MTPRSSGRSGTWRRSKVHCRRAERVEIRRLVHLLSGQQPWEHLAEELQLELPASIGVTPTLRFLLRSLTAAQRKHRIQTAAETLRVLDGTFSSTG